MNMINVTEYKIKPEAATGFFDIIIKTWARKKNQNHNPTQYFVPSN